MRESAGKSTSNKQNVAFGHEIVAFGHESVIPTAPNIWSTEPALWYALFPRPAKLGAQALVGAGLGVGWDAMPAGVGETV